MTKKQKLWCFRK